MTRSRCALSDGSLATVNLVVAILDEQRDYWPLTLRQVYYQLVAAGEIANKLGQYKRLSRVLTKARLGGLVPWESIEDRARSMLHSGGWPDLTAFVESELSSFLTGYRRDLLCAQDVALEVWVEKDALSRICHRAAFPYCVPVVVARGFASISYVNSCRDRVEQNAREGRRTIILYFGDLDPSGWEMLPTMMTTLHGDMGLADLVEGVRCALTPGQVDEYSLPRNPGALKKTDPRARKYLRQFGDLAVELDALRPSALENLVVRSIEQQLDLRLVEQERERQAREWTRLASLRSTVTALVSEETEIGEGASE